MGGALQLAMDVIGAQLAVAEFEAIWLQVRYYEGHATGPEVEEAVRRVNELRLIAHELDVERTSGSMFPHPESAPSLSFGH